MKENKKGWLTNMINTIEAVRGIVEQAEKFRSVYFWAPQSTAGFRRSMEQKESRPRVEWEEGGNHYSAEFVVDCRCSHTEVRGIYTRNGKRTTLTAIKNSLKRLESEVLDK